MPEERLDVMDRTMRLRGLPATTYQATADWDRVMVVQTDGTVKWRDAATLGSGGIVDCHWTRDPMTNRMYTAWSTPTVLEPPYAQCPEKDWHLGIGTTTLPAKLNVQSHNTSDGGSASSAIIGEHFTPTGGTGVAGTVYPETTGSTLSLDATGVWGTVNNLGKSGNGTRGDVFVTGSSTTEANGAFGFVKLLSGSSTVNAYGVRANVISDNGSGAANVFGAWAKVEGTVTVTNTLTAVLGLAQPAGGTTPTLMGGDFYANFSSISGTTNSTGVSAWSRTTGTNTVVNSIGVDAIADNGTGSTLGVSASAFGNSGLTIGTRSTALGPVALATGVFGRAQNLIDGTSVTRIGVRGSIFPVGPSDLLSAHASILGDFAGNGVEQWSGFFDGKVGATQSITAGVVSVFSDESIKTDVQPLSDQATNLMSLQAHSYQYTDEARERLHLPEGEQIGFLAQEVQEVFPSLVSQVTIMARLDSSGNVTAPPMPLSAVNYSGLIPVLVSGHQQQESRIGALEAQLAQLQEQLAACCVANNGGRGVAGGTSNAGYPETDLRIIPNPVADQTELRYTVGTEGRVRLEITDAAGRSIQVQDEGSRTTGAYLYEWNTTLLAPGTYFCTLYVNDEPLVKKAVKLNAR